MGVVEAGRLALLWILVCIAFPCPWANAGETCIRRDGLEVCGQALGLCDLSELMSREQPGLGMEMFAVTVINHSDRRIRIHPADFAVLTETGKVVQVDASLLDGIEVRSKLRRADLGPGERVKGRLFFPAYMGPFRALIYRGFPAFEIRFY